MKLLALIHFTLLIMLYVNFNMGTPAIPDMYDQQPKGHTRKVLMYMLQQLFLFM